LRADDQGTGPPASCQRARRVLQRLFTRAPVRGGG
jgi:hypothetical protein